jgi:hypothetical protein
MNDVTGYCTISTTSSVTRKEASEQADFEFHHASQAELNLKDFEGVMLGA